MDIDIRCFKFTPNYESPFKSTLNEIDIDDLKVGDYFVARDDNGFIVNKDGLRQIYKAAGEPYIIEHEGKKHKNIDVNRVNDITLYNIFILSQAEKIKDSETGKSIFKIKAENVK